MSRGWEFPQQLKAKGSQPRGSSGVRFKQWVPEVPGSSSGVVRNFS